MIVPAGSVVDPEWAGTAEGQEFFGALLHRDARRAFGLAERPALSPRAAAAGVASYKVFVSGKSGVGKTALVATLAGLEVPRLHHETAGIQTTTLYWPAKLRESGRPLFFKFSFWDCGEAALKKFGHLLPACTEKVDAFLFLFSYADRASFEDLPNQMSQVSDGTRSVTQMVVGTKFDQFAHTDVTESDVVSFRRTWAVPVLKAKSVPQLADRQELGGSSEVAHLLNRLAEHLWRQDQVVAGLLPAAATSSASLEEGSPC